MLEKSAFNRRLHRLANSLSVLFYYLADFFKALNLSGQYLIDWFPVAVCDNIRISRCRLVEGEEHRGKVASKRRFFFGFRVQLITTRQGTGLCGDDGWLWVAFSNYHLTNQRLIFAE